jgi:hypothetical protein
VTVLYRGVTTPVGGGNPTLSVNVPAGVQDGDLLLMQISGTLPDLPGAPAGWDLVDGSTNGNFTIRIFSRTADNEPASYTVTQATTEQYAAAIVAFYSDTAQALVVADVTVVENGGSGNTTVWPSVTTTADGGFLACFGTSGTNLGRTPPAGMDERYDTLSGSCRVYLMTGALATAGASGTRTTTHIVGMATRVISVAVEEGAALPLDASLLRWLRVQAGKQAEFGTAVAMDFALPVTFDYQQGDVEQVAEWDAGRWTGTEIVELTAEYATFTLRGALFFELLPVLFNAGFAAMTASGLGPYSYSGSGGPDAVGVPVPYTFRFGGDEGAVGSMMQVQDAYCHALRLNFNLNDKIVRCESQWFGRRIDDNDGAGYAPTAVPLPTGLAMVNGLRSTVGLQDAGESGGAFDALAEFECSLIEWALDVDTGLRPTWAADQNGLTYCGVRHETPRATWLPHIRTTADNYAVTLTKAQARTFQEVQMTWVGTDREVVVQMTGRWLGKLHAHSRSGGEVVMQPQFRVATPASQTTTPHWMSWAIEAGWEH